MALREKDEAMTYVGVYDGQLEVRVDKKTPGAIEREKTKQGKPTGESIFVKYYRSLEGRITDIKKETKKMPDGVEFTSLKIFIDDIGDKYVLNFPYDSDPTRIFYKLMENIDFNSTVEFSVSKSKNLKGKDVTSLFLKQNGANLKQKYTREYQYAPGEPVKPEWKQIMYKGKEVWDNTGEMQFFEKILEEKIVPKLKAKGQPAPVNHGSVVEDDSWIPSAEPGDPRVGNPPNDDEPF